MSEQKYEASSIIFHVHGHAVTLNPGIGYVHGHITTTPTGKAVVTVERDEKTGRVTVRVDNK
jgi:hypothetical protein